MTEKLLKLKAADAEDVQVISAILQDAIVPVVDIAYRPEDKAFIMVSQRLRREIKDKEGLTRICCAVGAKGVEAVQIYNIDLKQTDRMLELLAVVLENNVLTFICAGDAKIRLQLGPWYMALEDFGEAWPAKCNPCHDEGSAA
jgi:Protein of unknown function (DUF2948)